MNIFNYSLLTTSYAQYCGWGIQSYGDAENGTRCKKSDDGLTFSYWGPAGEYQYNETRETYYWVAFG